MFAGLVSIAALAAMIQADPCAPAVAHVAEARNHVAAERFREGDEAAERAVGAAPGCLAAHLVLAEAIDGRLDTAGGLAALDLSRRYRRAFAAALEIDPGNVEARTVEIGYLIHAPGIAGGDRRRATRRIGELEAIDPVAAAEMRVELARASGGDGLIEALATLTVLTPDDYGLRRELARRLILADAFREADAELATWPDGDAWREAERDYLRGALRALGGFELEAAEVFLERVRAIEPDTDDGREWPAEAGALALIGTAREGRGDRAGARDAYQAALSEDAGNERARAGLARLNAQ